MHFVLFLSAYGLRINDLISENVWLGWVFLGSGGLFFLLYFLVIVKPYNADKKATLAYMHAKEPVFDEPVANMSNSPTPIAAGQKCAWLVGRQMKVILQGTVTTARQRCNLFLFFIVVRIF